MDMAHWHTEASQIKESMNGGYGKLDNAIYLCGEMKRRMSAEMPRDRFQETEFLDGNAFVWTFRMTAEWLEATKTPA